MSDICHRLHQWANKLPRFRFPFDRSLLPKNGAYILFESGEKAHAGDRIVRIGTHTGENQLPSRLQQHFVKENKDRSIFRKNIGRSLLAQSKDSFAAHWEIDLTSQRVRSENACRIDTVKQREIEREVSHQIQANFSFAVLRIPVEMDRMKTESKLISTVSMCELCVPSVAWLGRFSPKLKIRECGLWLVNEIYKQPLSHAELDALILENQC